MIGIIDITNPEQPLLKEEFVMPLISIVSQITNDYLVITPEDIPEDSHGLSAIIISGTSLKDTWYLYNSHLTTSLFKKKIPILGICAGAQLLASFYGSELQENLEIGDQELSWSPADDPILKDLPRQKAYCLHSIGFSQPVHCDSLLNSASCVQLFRHQEHPHYGVLFHPEVRWQKLITNFINQVAYRK